AKLEAYAGGVDDGGVLGGGEDGQGGFELIVFVHGAAALRAESDEFPAVGDSEADFAVADRFPFVFGLSGGLGGEGIGGEEKEEREREAHEMSLEVFGWWCN